MIEGRMESVTCGKCGGVAMGRFNAAFLEKTGWRQVDGEWNCPSCTGLFWERLKDKPDVLEWLAEQKEKLDAEDAGASPGETP